MIAFSGIAAPATSVSDSLVHQLLLVYYAVIQTMDDLDSQKADPDDVFCRLMCH